MLRKFLCMFVFMLFCGAFANADTTTFTFDTTIGVLPASVTFHAGNLSLVATGYASPGIPTSLFNKEGGGSGLTGEDGLGIAGGIDHEIEGTEFIQLNLASIIAAHSHNGSISVASIQGTDAYNVWGSHTAGVLGTELLSHQTGFSAPLPGFGSDQFISISAASGTVLLDNLEVKTEEPGTITLMMFGILVALAWFGLQRKKT